jgi:uncharacterized protein (DUF1800 family)
MKRFLTLTVAIVAVSTSAATLPNDDRAIVHVLSRTGFGPRPGDVERIRAMGLQRYIDEQLHPERIPDAAIASRLAGLTTIGMSSRQIAEQYELPQLEARRRRKAEGKDNDAAPGDGKQPPDAMQQRAPGVMIELSEQKLLRAVYSDRQLQEVLTDFWFNHFNVDARKGRDRFLLTEYEREAIRPRVLGKFRDLLGATAKSPAMLFYLDNWMSADPNAPQSEMGRPRAGRGSFGGGFSVPELQRAQAQGKRAPKGLNENYGRELMELHTLGVDGGYTQKDVTEVARAFTGWTIDNPRSGGGFTFNARIHDTGEKLVLGHVFKAGGGEADGEQVLDILAKHPSTATFMATKLTRRFVSDTPPQALVERVAARFRDTVGDLREVMRTILTSPEFLSPDAYRAEVKTPFEFVVSALRATGAQVRDARPLVHEVQQLGMPLYQCQPPTGYKDTGDAWVNTGALVGRMNLAVRLAAVQLRGASVNCGLWIADCGLRTPGMLDSDGLRTDSDVVVARLLNGDASENTRVTIAKATDAQKMLALALGAPEFQRR